MSLGVHATEIYNLLRSIRLACSFLTDATPQGWSAPGTERSGRYPSILILNQSKAPDRAIWSAFPVKRIGFQFPHERRASAEELLSYARLADRLGYDTIFVPESWSRDAFTTLGAIAAVTERVRLGPGIVNVFSRTPALINS